MNLEVCPGKRTRSSPQPEQGEGPGRESSLSTPHVDSSMAPHQLPHSPKLWLPTVVISSTTHTVLAPVFPYLMFSRVPHLKINFLPLNASPRACCLGEIKLRKPLMWEYWSWVVTTRHC